MAACIHTSTSESKVAYLNAPMPFVIGVNKQQLDGIDLTFVDEV